MRSYLGFAACAAVLGLGLAACETVKPYEKEFLLHPAMDDAATAPLMPELMSAAAASVEKLGASGPGGGGATSCPTCGG